MKRIFISYRRKEFYDASRLARLLQNEFGPNVIFFDTESMHPGVDWPQEIRIALDRSDVMLLVIGPNWLHYQDELSGRRKIDLDTDWVRREITVFLERKKQQPKLTLIPVLVNGARMPEKAYLNPPIDAICDLQGIAVAATGKTSDFDAIRIAVRDIGFLPINPEPVSTPIGGPRPDRLTHEEEDDFLHQHPNWMIVESDKPGTSGDYMRQLYRMFEFSGYDEAWRFIQRVDESVIRPLNHHPKWQNTWNRVEFWLCTFNIGHKPSGKDITIAGCLEKIWEEEFRQS